MLMMSKVMTYLDCRKGLTVLITCTYLNCMKGLTVDYVLRLQEGVERVVYVLELQEGADHVDYVLRLQERG